jgi:hypothetical protein
VSVWPAAFFALCLFFALPALGEPRETDEDAAHAVGVSFAAAVCLFVGLVAL